jgi:hypothetical protein
MIQLLVYHGAHLNAIANINLGSGTHSRPQGSRDPMIDISHEIIIQMRSSIRRTISNRNHLTLRDILGRITLSTLLSPHRRSAVPTMKTTTLSGEIAAVAIIIQIFHGCNRLAPVVERLSKDTPLTILGGMGMMHPRIVYVTVAFVLEGRRDTIAVVEGCGGGNDVVTTPVSDGGENPSVCGRAGVGTTILDGTTVVPVCGFSPERGIGTGDGGGRRGLQRLDSTQRGPRREVRRRGIVRNHVRGGRGTRPDCHGVDELIESPSANGSWRGRPVSNSST